MLTSLPKSEIAHKEECLRDVDCVLFVLLIENKGAVYENGWATSELSFSTVGMEICNRPRYFLWKQRENGVLFNKT